MSKIIFKNFKKLRITSLVDKFEIVIVRTLLSYINKFVLLCVMSTRKLTWTRLPAVSHRLEGDFPYCLIDLNINAFVHVSAYSCLIYFIW